MSAVVEHAVRAGAAKWRDRLRSSAREMFTRSWWHWRPPAQIGTREWADENLYLPPDIGTAKPGKYRSEVTPWLHAIQDALDDPTITEVVCMKSSQVAWTIGVITAYVAKRIDVDPCPIVIMFPTTDSAREYSDEKLTPIIDATPALRRRIDRRSRKSGNRATFKKFTGGFLKMVGSNSPRSVKSSSAPIIVVEEPDDASTDVKGQGDSITLLRDRAKVHARYKFLIGGTPTVAGVSSIDAAYKRSDQRKLFVPCHHCGEEHVLSWDNVRWDDSADIAHEIYGRAQPDTAAYYCPHCGGQWTDYDKNQNVARACRENRWRATSTSTGVAGFGHLSELYAHWPKSAFAYLVRRHLEAKHEADAGDDRKLVAFWNSTLGLPYEYGGEQVNVDQLSAKALVYAECTVPAGGLLLTVGVDVQDNRFAIIVRAWGRGEESWLVYWGEIFGTVTDRKDKVWDELEQRVFGGYRHACGPELHARAISIDSSDGGTSDQVYDWVRLMKRRHPSVQIMPVKGASDKNDKEIFSLPKTSVDHRTPTKAAKYGLRVYIVGTNKAKDLLLGGDVQRGRIHLGGDGPGRFHVYRDVRADYWDQVTAEVKAPSRRLRGRTVWQVRAGRRNEALDGEVYALHAARALKTHIAKPEEWNALEQQLRQRDLLQTPVAESETTAAAPTPAPAITPPPAPTNPTPARRRPGFVNRWKN